jgi:prepilin-type N-terminal cleavage/methylation domain-containing protein
VSLNVLVTPLRTVRERTRDRALERVRAARSGGAPDPGFTLVEVMVAIVLLSIVVVAGGGFMIRAMNSSAGLNSRQGAVTVANQAMERVRAVNPTFDGAGVSPLVYGRSQTDSVALWTAAAAAGLATGGTYTGGGITPYDAAAWSAGGVQNLPFSTIVSQGSQSYTVRTLIGTCVKLVATAACDRSLLGYEMFRAVIWVTWTPPSGGCSGQGCSYTSTSLIDPSQDQVFNSNRNPVANTDTATVASGGSVQMGVTANDSGTFALTGAVTIISQPSHGTTTVVAGTNIVQYSSTAGYSGTDIFSYTVTDATGLVSNIATDTVTVTPVGVNDTLSTTAKATANTVNVLGNDLGTGLTLTSITQPALGTAVISGNGISYTPPTAASGITTVPYTAKDSSGQTETAVLTVTVKPYVPTDQCFSILSLGIYSWTPTVTGTGPYTIQVISVTGVNLPGLPTILGFSLSGLYLGEKITFTITDGNGVVSDQQTVTVTLRIC